MKKLSILTTLSILALSLIVTSPAFAKDKDKENKGSENKINMGLHLGQIKKEIKAEIKIEKKSEPKRIKPTAASIAAYKAAVKKAQTDYNAALKSARTAYLAALKAARDQFLNPTSTPTTSINLAPTVATAASVSTSPVIGTSATLSVLGADDKGESNLIYTWSVVSKPAGASNPTFSANNSNIAKTTLVTFSQAGSYQFLVTITDAGGLTTSSNVSVTVNQTISHVTTTPATATLSTTGTLQLSTTSSDQFNQPITSGFTWSILEGVLGGLVNSLGFYTAPAITGTFHVIATSNVDVTKTGSSIITISP